MFRTFVTGVLVCLVAGLSPANAGESGKKQVGGRTYELVRGSFTQTQAWNEARKRGGIPVVFETMKEHSAVVAAFRLGTSEADVCHTGHYQLPDGREPQAGWQTYNKRASAKLCELFNSDGPDDGSTRKWGFCINCDGSLLYIESSYYGKNEDCGVVWKDAKGLLEDVSVNHRANVLIEYP